METIIKIAIEGGYKKIKTPFEVSGQYNDWVKFHHGSLLVSNKIYEYFCDPLFWQALGKACGWQTHGSHETRGNNLRCFRCGARWDEKGDCPKNEVRGWKIIALRFHEINLTEGWEKAVEYLISLINEE